MRYQVIVPCEQLQPFVKHLVISESTEQQTYRILPDTAVVIGFQYKGRISLVDGNKEQQLTAAGVTGLIDSYRIFKNTDQTGSILVIFTETGAGHFLKAPLHEIFKQSLSLAHFFNHGQIYRVREQLHFAVDDLQRIRIVENFLLAELKQLAPDLMVQNALTQIHQSKGVIRISKLASLLHTSQSPLEKRFRQIVGTSPKKFANIVRARHMLSAIEQNHQSTMDYLYAYHDQAHFIKDFKKITSYTPDQYARLIRWDTLLK